MGSLTQNSSCICRPVPPGLRLASSRSTSTSCVCEFHSLISELLLLHRALPMRAAHCGSFNRAVSTCTHQLLPPDHSHVHVLQRAVIILKHFC